jgi:CelD/BcsL family acetyltransferase involved in cellulose biosynthesis
VPDMRAQAPLAGGTATSSISGWPFSDTWWSEWDCLLDRSGQGTLFLTRAWMEAWWTAYGTQREALPVCVRDAGGALIGAAALMRQRSPTLLGLGLEIRFLGDGTGDSDELAPIAAPGRHPAVAAALLDWLREHSRLWDALALETLPASGPASVALEEGLRSAGWLRAQSMKTRLVLPLPDDWEGYLASLSRNGRTALTYKPRRLAARHRVGIRRVERAADAGPALDTLFRLHTCRWRAAGHAGNFAAEARRAFYKRLAPALLECGALDFWLLDVDGEPAAAHFGGRAFGTHYLLESGFAPELAPLGVGTVLTAAVVRNLVEEGVAGVDFQAGDETFKRRLGARDETYAGFLAARPWSRGAGLMRARRLRQRLGEAARAVDGEREGTG